MISRFLAISGALSLLHIDDRFGFAMRAMPSRGTRRAISLPICGAAHGNFAIIR